MKTFIHLTLSIFLLLTFAGKSHSQGSTLGDTLMSFNAGILTPTPDRGLQGVVFAEGYIWVTGFDPDDLYQHKLYKFSADGQQLVEYWDYGIEFAGWKGLAYDGRFLYVADIDTIRQIDPQTGQKTGVKIPGPEYYLSGLTYDPDSDHFWVSGDGNIIFEVDRQGNIISSVPFTPDLPASGLAWDTFTAGGPYLWVWSMKYTPDDVRPKAFQLNPANGSLTGLEFEGVLMNPDQIAADYSLGATITDQLIEGEVVFLGMHASSYEVFNDQLDWVVGYDLDPDGTGIPGPQISVNPANIQNDLYPGDSIDIAVSISNFSESFSMDWLATLEYPGMTDTSAVLGDTLQAYDATILTPDTNTRLNGIAFSGDHIYVYSGVDFDDQFRLYKMDKSSGAVLQTFTFFSAFSGWRAMAADDQFIYGAEQYSITKFDPASGTIVDNYPKTGFSPSAMAYDPQQELFYMGGGTGAVKVIDKQDNEINFYVTPYDIEGLAWDSWSPGGPYLWVSYLGEADSTLGFVRLDPSTGNPAGVQFTGLDLNGEPSERDLPEGAFVTPGWQQNKLVMLALQQSNTMPGDGHDKIVVYDLATTPPPGWIELLPISYGNTPPEEDDTLMVRMKAIMEDTLVVAQIVISSNDVLSPEVVIPVNFTMLGTITGTKELPGIENALHIYPNPADGLINIIHPYARIDRINIYTLSGQLELSLRTEDKTVDISTLQPGMYILEVMSENSKVRRKLMVR